MSGNQCNVHLLLFAEAQVSNLFINQSAADACVTVGLFQLPI